MAKEMGKHVAALSMVAVLEGEFGKELTDLERRNLAIDMQTRAMQEGVPGTRPYKRARKLWLELHGE